MALLPPGVHEHFPDNREALTPLFRQYLEIKDAHPGALLFYRLGDFYEMFGPDAIRGASILGLTLTARAAFKDYKVAMCGVPHHSSARYIRQLVRAGCVIAVCEQTEDPSEAKGLVERGVTRVITAGTLVEDEYLAGDESNLLAVVARGRGGCGVALLESGSGQVQLFELSGATLGQAAESALRFTPGELLLPKDNDPAELRGVIRPGGGPAVHYYDDLPAEKDVRYFLERYFETSSLGSFGLDGRAACQSALFALVRYLKETLRSGTVRLYPRFTPLSGVLYLDARTVGHLELLADPGPGGSPGLISLLDNCRNPGGRRELRRWLLEPLADADAISARHGAVETLTGGKDAATNLARLIGGIQDIERIVHRVGLRRTNPREVRVLTDSLPHLTQLGQLLLDSPDALLQSLGSELGDFGALYTGLDAQLSDDPPYKPSDGGVVRDGADALVDELRCLARGGREWFDNYEQAQRERTGIRTLKVKSTGAFGYFIEVSKANLALVPDDYTRKQTLVNSERFVTPELQEYERKVAEAEGRLAARESELFEAVCAKIDAEQERLARAARAMAQADVLLSLAEAAAKYRWVRPRLSTADGDTPLELEVEDARHPLVELAVGERYYTKNDVFLSAESQQVLLLTGPNMGGKSTYLRMAAVICVLSQLGSFVPAAAARLPVLDRIYTRVGAQDRLSAGQSTFMVEMVETAEILNTCSGRSLVLLDEVGRGTSTYDGISIAKAVVEFLHEHPARPLTLFATHFFELTDMALMLERLKNFQVEVAEQGGEYVFLYRVSPGAASDSYGIEVARLAGLPEVVVDRARSILAELEEAREAALERARHAVQMGLFKKQK